MLILEKIKIPFQKIDLLNNACDLHIFYIYEINDANIKLKKIVYNQKIILIQNPK